MNPKRSDAVRRYSCLACEDTVTEFHTCCPSCGGTAFKTNSESTDEPTSAVQRVVQVAAPLNPYIPR